MRSSELPVSEWDFSSCGEDRLHCCWVYEHARHLPKFIREIEALRSSHLEEGEEHGQINGNGCIHWSVKMFYPEKGDIEEVCNENIKILVPPEFPRSPFLDVPPHRQLKWEPPVIDPLIPLPLTVYPFVEAAAHYKKVSFAGFEGESFGGAGMGGLGQTLHGVLINWNHSDAAIEEAFSDWLRASRAANLPPAKQWNQQGKPASKRLKRELKELAAYRLLSRMDWTSALLVSKAESGDKQPLYERRESWPKAKTSTLKRFKRLCADSAEPDPWLSSV